MGNVQEEQEKDNISIQYDVLVYTQNDSYAQKSSVPKIAALSLVSNVSILVVRNSKPFIRNTKLVVRNTKLVIRNTKLDPGRHWNDSSVHDIMSSTERFT